MGWRAPTVAEEAVAKMRMADYEKRCLMRQPDGGPQTYDDLMDDLDRIYDEIGWPKSDGGRWKFVPPR